ncbi:MAG: hypothetical protein ACE5NG_14185 [bacterium]
MKKSLVLLIKLTPFFVFVSAICAQETFENALTFIVAADMRNFATEGNQSPQHFSGALLAIKEVGKGAFMISPGDIDVDPASSLQEVISKVLGEDYPWYPVVGNHEPESPSTMEYIKGI